MKTRYIKWKYVYDNLCFIKQYRVHFWNKWKTVIDPRNTKPQLYRIINNEYIAL